MPLMEPRSPWASTHGEKTSIPNIRIDLAEFGIGKLLSCGRLTSNTRANSPVPFLLGRNLTRLQEQVKLKRMQPVRSLSVAPDSTAQFLQIGGGLSQKVHAQQVFSGAP